MKKLALLFLCLTVAVSFSQVETPAPSPLSKIEQKVGLTTITVEYSRPGVKGRQIFGNLIEYGKLWRAGANARTKITFSDDVKIANNNLKAGTYAIFITPQEKSWDVIFYTEYAGSGAPRDIDESKVAAKVSTPVINVPFNVETMMFDINNITNTSASIDLIWEKSYISIPFTVPTETKVLSTIEKTMNGPATNDYYAAAVYYLESGKDINKAKLWIDKAIDATNDNPRFWMLRQQALIYAKAGDKVNAIQIAKQSLELAKKSGNAAYVKNNKASIAEWSK